MSIFLKNVIVNGEKQNVLIDGKVIKSISFSEKTNVSTVKNAIDCKGEMTLLPAFVDMHTHLREPGFEYKEDIASGAAAAVKGGFASVCCMPNTKPTIDNKYIVKYIVDRAKEVNLAKVYPIAAITVGLQGECLAEIGKLKEAGAVAVSDDGQPVTTSQMMCIALEYCKDFDMPVISHCEDKDLVNGGVMNEGAVSAEIGLKGIPSAAEDVMISREIILAEMLNTRVHIAHVSTRSGAQIIREAKARGVKVTAETCPHYIAGTDALLKGYNTMAKVNPPLRGEKDRLAIIEAIADGTIDVIATDHAPHSKEEKADDIMNAPNGISGLESAFQICYTYLVKSGKMTLEQLSKKMTANPASIVGVSAGELKEGGLADLVVIDTNCQSKINSQTFVSKGKNTPFDGLKVYGQIALTIVEGEIKYSKL